VTSVTDFFDAASQRHTAASDVGSGNDFVPAGQCTDTPRRARATVELLRQETPNFLVSKLWLPNSPNLSPLDYEIWAVMQHRVYHRQIHSVDELKRRLINVWCSRCLTRLLTRKTSRLERVSMLKEDISSTACDLTILILSTSVTFHSCSFYKVVH